jgi:hypothetical protein
VVASSARATALFDAKEKKLNEPHHLVFEIHCRLERGAGGRLPLTLC